LERYQRLLHKKQLTKNTEIYRPSLL